MTYFLFRILGFSLILCTLAHANPMMQSLKYLASDEREGRRAGSVGNALAAQYLETELFKLGLLPMGDSGSYQQKFTIFTKMIKNGPNILKTSNNNPAPFEPLSFSASGSIKKVNLVFVGHGITLPPNFSDFTYDDYEDVDVKGKIVVMLSGDPGFANPDSPFRNPEYISYRTLIYKLGNAQKHGALGAILLPHPMGQNDQQTEPLPTFNPTDGGGIRIDLLAGLSTNTWLNQFLKTRKILNSTLEIQKHIGKTQAPNSFQLDNVFIDLSVHLKKETGQVSNVIGLIPGSDEILKREIMVLGAHFDHLGNGGQASNEPLENLPCVHYGADDNASGTALLLNLANVLSKQKPKRSILFAFFNAEEIGILGSDHLIETWPSNFHTQYGNLYGMINFDMVGRFQQAVAIIGTGTAFEWEQYLGDVLPWPELPFVQQTSSINSSDHYSFTKNGIPALYYTTGPNKDYHRCSDTPDLIDYDSMSKITDHILDLINRLDNNDDTLLTFNPESIQDPITPDPDPGPSQRARLGCIPDFGNNDDITGVLCSDSVPNSPADHAGIISGDIIIQIGDIEIKSLYDLAFALKFYLPGDSIPVSWKRENVIFTKEITLERRR